VWVFVYECVCVCAIPLVHVCMRACVCAWGCSEDMHDEEGAACAHVRELRARASGFAACGAVRTEFVR